MNNKQEILELLRSVADGSTSPEQALLHLKEEPFEDLDFAKIDHHRGIRQGASEVVYGAGKTPEQIRGIVEAMGAKGCRNILVTRIEQDTADGRRKRWETGSPGSMTWGWPDFTACCPTWIRS